MLSTTLILTNWTELITIRKHTHTHVRCYGTDVLDTGDWQLSYGIVATLRQHLGHLARQVAHRRAYCLADVVDPTTRRSTFGRSTAKQHSLGHGVTNACQKTWNQCPTDPVKTKLSNILSKAILYESLSFQVFKLFLFTKFCRLCQYLQCALAAAQCIVISPVSVCVSVC